MLQKTGMPRATGATPATLSRKFWGFTTDKRGEAASGCTRSSHVWTDGTPSVHTGFARRFSMAKAPQPRYTRAACVLDGFGDEPLPYLGGQFVVRVMVEPAIAGIQSTTRWCVSARMIEVSALESFRRPRRRSGRAW